MSGPETMRRRRIFPHLSSDDVAAKEYDKKKEVVKKEGEKNGVYDNAKSNKPSAASTNGVAQPAKSSSWTSSSAAHHLLPLPLVIITLLCSGLFWVMSFRDAFATGQPLLLNLSAAPSLAQAELSLLEHTKSQKWYHDDDTSKAYWKSSRGGLGSIRPYTSDDNDMGGLFVRKMAGVAAMGYHTTKLWPIVFQSAPVPSIVGGQGIKMKGASWSIGHYDAILTLGVLGNFCIAAFYMMRIDELRNAGAEPLVEILVMASLIEALVFGAYLMSRRMSMKKTTKVVGKQQQQKQQKRPAQTKKGSKDKDASSSSFTPSTNEYNPQEDPDSIPSRIALRTVFIVSSTISLIAMRDIFFAGTIISFIPRDDIYLEWTGAFFHSPPPDTVEADEYGLESPLYAGDKFMSQLLGMYLVLSCVWKFASVVAWSKGNRSMEFNSPENVDRHGVVSSKMIWRAQAFGDMLLLFMLRMFAPAAKSASLDLRWHLMTVAYEMIILGLYGFF
ncbi:hypothetical protein ACHAWT_005853 [Skeletonema menzelii]